MLKNYLLVAGGFVSTVIVLKIFFRKPPPPNVTYEMSSNIEEDDSENMSMMSTIDENLPKLWVMKKEELVDECLRRNIACLGTVRVLRERLRVAREEDA